MDARDALNLTIDLYGLQAKQLADLSGVDQYQISKYRHKKKDMNTATFFRLVHAMPSDAAMFLLSKAGFDSGRLSS